jgi:hypothetical protein
MEDLDKHSFVYTIMPSVQVHPILLERLKGVAYGSVCFSRLKLYFLFILFFLLNTLILKNIKNKLCQTEH